jgi:Protein of unknown function (DUF4231)
MEKTPPTLERLEDQIAWYDGKSGYNQRWYRRLKIIEILSASTIPFLAGFAPMVVTGAMGVIIVVLQGFQHVFQFQENWTSYRSTCESLKHEKYLWLGKAGPYRNIEDPDSVLADRVESLISTEHAKWIASQDQSGKKGNSS